MLGVWLRRCILLVYCQATSHHFTCLLPGDFTSFYLFTARRLHLRTMEEVSSVTAEDKSEDSAAQSDAVGPSDHSLQELKQKKRCASTANRPARL